MGGLAEEGEREVGREGGGGEVEQRRGVGGGVRQKDCD